jgi:hypothetical protein
MRSLMDFSQDKFNTTFESKPKGYLEIYNQYFESTKNNEIRLLELGVASGMSMKMWKYFFCNGVICGVDLTPPEILEPGIHVYQGLQNDTALLTSIASEHAPNGFDIIIDDCAHIGELAKTSFWHLFDNHLKPGGVYAIEDWGTGYWGNHVYYPDGRYFNPKERKSLLHYLANIYIKSPPVSWPKINFLLSFLKRYQYTTKYNSHNYGMVGFVKQLIDEVGIGDITHPKEGISLSGNSIHKQLQPKIKNILYCPGIVFVTKK